MKIPHIQTSWDDGDPLDLKVAALLTKYGILDSIFFWPVKAGVIKPEWALFIARNFEIGAHTVNHHILTELSLHDAYNEISGGKKWLEDAFAQKIDAFCYPRGRYTPEVKDLVMDAGFRWARTTVIGNESEQPDMFRKPADVHVYPRKEYNGLGFLEYSLKAWEEAKQKEYPIFHIWGHSWEVEKLGLWDDLEKLFAKIFEDTHSASA